MQRRQFLTTSALTLAGVLSGNTPARAITIRAYEGTCRSPIFGVYGDYKIVVQVEKNKIPRVELVWEGARDFTSDGYTETVDREEVLERIERNKQIFGIAETTASLLGFSNPFGISLEQLLSKASSELSQELAHVERWDIYKHRTGTFAGSRLVTTTEYISFRPSNMPEVKNIRVTTKRGQTTISWDCHDGTNYPDLDLPWHRLKVPELPLNNIDLTIYLDEPYGTSNPSFDVQVLQRGHEVYHETRSTSSVHFDLTKRPGEEFKVRIIPIDDAGNIGEPKYANFTTESNVVAQQPSLRQQTTQHQASSNDTQSIEDIVKTFMDLEKAQEDSHISNTEANQWIQFYKKHVSTNLASRLGFSPNISREEAKRKMFDAEEREAYGYGIRIKNRLDENSIRIDTHRNTAEVYFDLICTSTVPPPLEPSGTSRDRIRINFDLIKLGDIWKINDMGGNPVN